MGRAYPVPGWGPSLTHPRGHHTAVMFCGRVLVLDDDDEMLAALAEVLRMDGVPEVGVAASVREAQLAIRGGFVPCVVLLDLVLHNEQGEDFLNWLVDVPEREAVRVVALSGDEPRLRSVERTVASGLLKPSDPDRILAALAQAWADLVPAAGPPMYGE
jgi:DNA-binding NtrC family response regulator